MTTFDHQTPIHIQAAAWSITAVGMEIFAAELIQHSRTESGLDHAVIQACRDRALLSIRDADSRGSSIQDEAEFIGQAVRQLEQLLDSAIAKGWKFSGC